MLCLLIQRSCVSRRNININKSICKCYIYDINTYITYVYKKQQWRVPGWLVVKDPVLSLLWRSFKPWPMKFCIPQEKKKSNTTHKTTPFSGSSFVQSFHMHLHVDSTWKNFILTTFPQTSASRSLHSPNPWLKADCVHSITKNIWLL